MSSIKQSLNSARAEFAACLQEYLQREHDLHLGTFEAEEVFDGIFAKVAPLLYNQALNDAKTFFEERMHTVAEDIIQLEIRPPTSKALKKPSK